MVLLCHACHTFTALPHDDDQGPRILTVDTPCDRCGAVIKAKGDKNHQANWAPIVMAPRACAARGHTHGSKVRHPDGRCSVCLAALP